MLVGRESSSVRKYALIKIAFSKNIQSSPKTNEQSKVDLIHLTMVPMAKRKKAEKHVKRM